MPEHKPPTSLGELVRRADALPYVRDPSLPPASLQPPCGARSSDLCKGCSMCGDVPPEYAEYMDKLAADGLETCKRSQNPSGTLMELPRGHALWRRIVVPLQQWRDESYDPNRDIEEAEKVEGASDGGN